jgi:hypothetical protein
MDRPKLEVADIFRRYGEAYRQQHDGSLSTAHGSKAGEYVSSGFIAAS